MRDFLDDRDLLATLRMLRTLDQRVILLVEGDSDVRALKRLIDNNHSTIVSSHNKSSLINAMATLEELGDNLDGCVGLVDRDFDHWGKEQESILPSNVYETELYDLEADLLIMGGLLDDFLVSVLDVVKTRKLLSKSNDPELQTIIVRMAATIGKVRWASIRDSLKLKLSRFPIIRVIEDQTLVRESAVVELALQRSPHCDSNLNDILNSCSKILPSSNDQEFCCGHDIVRTLAATSSHWATRTVKHSEIETFVAGAVRCDVIERLKWFDDLARSAANQGHRLWNCPA